MAAEQSGPPEIDEDGPPAWAIEGAARLRADPLVKAAAMVFVLRPERRCPSS